MLQTQTVTSGLLELLTRLMTIKEFEDLRLVGGTSLALQFGHRSSEDIDLFGRHDVDDFALSEILSQFETVKSLPGSKSIKIFLVNGIKVDIVNYPYEWIEDAIEADGFKLAGKKDIAAMKIAAIAQRGSKKDFIDLYFLLRDYSLGQLMEFYEKKITDGNTWMALRSLAYFDDAEKQPMPRMFKDVSWLTMKALIRKEVAIYQKLF